MAERDQFLHELLSDIVAIKFNVFHSLEEHWIPSCVDGSLIITFHCIGVMSSILNSRNNLLSQAIQLQLFSHFYIQPQ